MSNGSDNVAQKTPEVSLVHASPQQPELAKPAKSEVSRTAQQPAPPVMLTPAAWAIEALRIDHDEVARRARRGFFLRLFLFVGLPTLLTAFYIFVYATPRYVSEFQITYQTYTPSSSSSSSGIAGLLGAVGLSSGGGSVDMSQVLTSYLQSDAVLMTIDKELDLRKAFSDSKIDWLDRMDPDASNEDFLKYFNRRVDVENMMGGYIIIDVEGFDPKFATAIATAMSKAADVMVDKLTARARAEEVRAAEVELKRTQNLLVQASLDVTNFQNDHRDFNPMTMAKQIDTVVGDLEAQLSEVRAELARNQTFLGDQSAQVFVLKSRATALEQQIADEKHRLATAESGGSSPQAMPYSKLVATFTSLELEQKFASDAYISAKQAYDFARADASHQQNYVESFVAPSTPQRSMSPNPRIDIPAVFFLSLITYAIGSLVIGSFRTQAGL